MEESKFLSIPGKDLDICCAASVASEQQHKQDLRKIYRRETNSRIDHFLPECIAFNQTALRHF